MGFIYIYIFTHTHRPIHTYARNPTYTHIYPRTPKYFVSTTVINFVILIVLGSLCADEHNARDPDRRTGGIDATLRHRRPRHIPHDGQEEESHQGHVLS